MCVAVSERGCDERRKSEEARGAGSAEGSGTGKVRNILGRVPAGSKLSAGAAEMAMGERRVTEGERGARRAKRAGDVWSVDRDQRDELKWLISAKKRILRGKREIEDRGRHTRVRMY